MYSNRSSSRINEPKRVLVRGDFPGIKSVPSSTKIIDFNHSVTEYLRQLHSL